MANAADQVSTTALMDIKRDAPAVGRRREWPQALKRQMVAETLEPGASAYGALANVRFAARRAAAEHAKAAQLRIPMQHLLPGRVRSA